MALGRSPELAGLTQVGEKVARTLAGLPIERDQLGDHGVQPHAVGVEGDRDPIMPVDHPVVVVVLDEVDRWKRLEPLVGQPKPLPARFPVLAAEWPEWQKVTAALGRSGYCRAADILDRHEPHPEFMGRGLVGLGVQLIQVGEWLPGLTTQPPSNRGLATGPGLAGRPEDGSDCPCHRTSHALQLADDAARRGVGLGGGGVRSRWFGMGRGTPRVAGRVSLFVHLPERTIGRRHEPRSRPVAPDSLPCGSPG